MTYDLSLTFAKSQLNGSIQLNKSPPNNFTQLTCLQSYGRAINHDGHIQRLQKKNHTKSKLIYNMLFTYKSNFVQVDWYSN